MTRTLPDIRVANRCVYLRPGLCGEPAPFLINGSSYCDTHASLVMADLSVVVKKAPGKSEAHEIHPQHLP